jgi:hypothetical protein
VLDSLTPARPSSRSFRSASSTCRNGKHQLFANELKQVASDVPGDHYLEVCSLAQCLEERFASVIELGLSLQEDKKACISTWYRQQEPKQQQKIQPQKGQIERRENCTKTYHLTILPEVEVRHQAFLEFLLDASVQQIHKYAYAAQINSRWSHDNRLVLVRSNIYLCRS